MSDVDTKYLGELSGLASLESDACNAIINVASEVGCAAGPEYALRALLISTAIAFRAHGIDQEKMLEALSVVYESVDEIVARIGADSVDVSSIVIELNLK